MYKTRQDHRLEWQFVLSMVALLGFLWGASLVPQVMETLYPTPTVGESIVVFSKTYGLTDQQRQDLTEAVASWMVRDPTLAERPLHVYQLMKRHQNVF